MLDSMRLIERAIYKILTILKKYYTNRREKEKAGTLLKAHEHQCYICVTSPDFHNRGGITIGNFGIESEDPAEAANAAATELYESIEHYESNIVIGDSFQIHYQIISGEYNVFNFV